MTVWWGWLLTGVAIGAVLTVWVAHETRLFRRTQPRAITIDLTGADLADPDDWFPR